MANTTGNDIIINGFFIDFFTRLPTLLWFITCPFDKILIWHGLITKVLKLYMCVHVNLCIRRPRNLAALKLSPHGTVP